MSSLTSLLVSKYLVEKTSFVRQQTSKIKGAAVCVENSLRVHNPFFIHRS